MPLDVIVAPRAERDFDDIHTFIASDNAAAADRLIGRLLTTINNLASRPHIGQIVVRPRRPGLRRMSVHPYIIFYRLTPTELQIVRVLHSSRDLHDALFA